MFEVVWDTKPFNNLEWPKDGSNPFVWSFGDATGFANHADYLFGWKGDALQKILDTSCYFNCPASVAKVQSIADMNKCSQKVVVDEDIDGCELRFPYLRNYNVFIADCADYVSGHQGSLLCLVDTKQITDQWFQSKSEITSRTVFENSTVYGMRGSSGCRRII